MKIRLLLLLALVIAAIYWTQRARFSGERVENDVVPEKTRPDLERGVTAPSEPEVSGGLITYHPLADALGDPSTPPEREPEMIYAMLQAYRRLAGAFPVAEDNPALMQKLRGKNEHRVRMFPATHPRYTRQGALLDAWGTPFFFHHLSRQQIEVRSAGPDRIFYTADDLRHP